jgi:hypothetical protein
MMERAFTSFLAIAPPDWKKPWRQASSLPEFLACLRIGDIEFSHQLVTATPSGCRLRAFSRYSSPMLPVHSGDETPATQSSQSRLTS